MTITFASVPTRSLIRLIHPSTSHCSTLKRGDQRTRYNDRRLKKKVPVYGQFGQRLSRKPHRVRVDNKSSSFFTIVEVFTYDFPGLLFSITDALFNCGLNIWVAKIATKADQVVDVFYVRDMNGQKVDMPDQVKNIKAAIMERLKPV